MPKMQPAGEDFLASAPIRAVETFRIARPAAEVWGELTSDRPLAWCGELDGTWTSARPFGVGTTRRMKVLGGLLTLQEHFFAWDEGRRHAFHGTVVNLPLFRRLAEDYVVAPDGPDRCTFTWTIAAEPTLVGRGGAPLHGLLFRRFFDDTRRHFAGG